MKPFTFRLAGLLSLREAERDARRTAFTAALAEQSLAIAGREVVERKLAEQQAEHRRVQAGGAVTLDVLLRAERYAASLRQELAERAAAERLAAAEVLRQRESLFAAEREVEILEKLREHQQARYQIDRSRVEVKQFDEVAAQRFSRAQASNSRAA
jgi:flagellar export protein FliJ